MIKPVQVQRQLDPGSCWIIKGLTPLCMKILLEFLDFGISCVCTVLFGANLIDIKNKLGPRVGL